MTYDDIYSYTSHAGTLLRKAGNLMDSIDTAFWRMKVNHRDNPSKKDVTDMNRTMEQIQSGLEAVMHDLNILKEEMKMYNKNYNQ